MQYCLISLSQLSTLQEPREIINRLTYQTHLTPQTFMKGAQSDASSGAEQLRLITWWHQANTQVGNAAFL